MKIGNGSRCAGGFLNRSVLWGVLLLGGILAASMAVVGKYRRPGAMTPIEAQSMQMELPAPAGTLPVELAPVERGRVAGTVRYSGQAVGYLEQDVAPRVAGTLVWMPLYAGDRVRRGQLIARLDTSQSAPQTANQRAMLDIAVQGVGVAQKEYEQTMAAIKEAHAEVGMKTGAAAEAKAEQRAAQEERTAARADLEAAQSQHPDAEAQLQAAQADEGYWKEEIERETRLLKAGAVTPEEFARERDQAVNAAAKVRQAQARIAQVEAQIRAAQAAASKAEALAGAATARVEEAQAELNSHFAHVNSTQAMAASARQKIAQAQAGVAQAHAALAGAMAQQGYSEIRAETDGVVMQRVVSPGVLVGAGQTILRIAQIAPIRLQANVSETDLPKIRVGGAVRVLGRDPESGSGEGIAAKVASVAPAVDAASRTAVVEALLPNADNRFLPGQFVTLEFTLGVSPNALHAPTRALRVHVAPDGEIISTRTTQTLWVADPLDGQPGLYTAREVVVSIGLTDGEQTEIKSGVKAGELVIVTGQDNLKPGDTVSRAEMSAPSMQAGIARSTGAPAVHTGVPTGSVAPARRLHYTCIMHPEIDLDHPGKCPKCGMTLVLRRNGGAR
jgi:RND family efflux transporter MFP subunit